MSALLTQTCMQARAPKPRRGGCTRSCPPQDHRPTHRPDTQSSTQGQGARASQRTATPGPAANAYAFPYELHRSMHVHSGTRGENWYHDRRAEWARKKARTQALWLLMLAGDWHPRLESERPHPKPHLMCDTLAWLISSSRGLCGQRLSWHGGGEQGA